MHRRAPWRRSRVQKHAEVAAFPAHPPSLSHAERQLPLKYIKEQAGNARLMLDVLIETVSYEPLAIFMIVAVVLLIMLARTY
jgi:hypothetical protein